MCGKVFRIREASATAGRHTTVHTRISTPANASLQRRPNVQILEHLCEKVIRVLGGNLLDALEVCRISSETALTKLSASPGKVGV